MQVLSGILLATCLALASGHHGKDGEVTCHCGAFATTPKGLVGLDDFPHEHVADCSKVDECKAVCQGAWVQTMGAGDLNAAPGTTFAERRTSPTVGQRFCNTLATNGVMNFGPAKVYAYSNICYGPLLYDNHESVQPLCCSNGTYKPCSDDPPTLAHTLADHDHPHPVDGHTHPHTHGDLTHTHPHTHPHTH